MLSLNMMLDFLRFYKREMRKPTIEEFVEMGYDKSFYNEMNAYFDKWEEEQELAGGNFDVR